MANIFLQVHCPGHTSTPSSMTRKSTIALWFCAYLQAGGRSVVENSLAELNLELDPEQFYQLNRKTITNVTAIQKISTYFNRRMKVQLKPDNLEAIVSRERVQDFKGWLDK